MPLPDRDDALIAALARRDAAAARILLEGRLPPVRRLADRLLRDPQDAEDLAQEVVLRALRHAPEWRSGRGRLDSWLRRVALNLCLDGRRRRREVPTARAPDRRDPAPGPEEVLIAREEARAVLAAVGRLPPRQRAALLLRYAQGASQAEAAAALGVSEAAVESLLGRARTALRGAAGGAVTPPRTGRPERPRRARGGAAG